MLTKRDLLAIQQIVDGSVSTSEKRLEVKLMEAMGKNTQDLIDLISVGFHMTDNLDARVSHLEKKVFPNAL
ncbi:MAG: hypothetical protein WA061_04825 [Microgenomates group bacterium]